MRNVSRFRLRAHTLKVEIAAWDTGNALLDADVCALKRKYAYLFNCFSGGDFSMEQPFLQQASVQDVSDFLLQHNNKPILFVSELMDIMLTGETSHRPISRTVWLKVPPYKS
eukprot:1143424-Pelagomonas_calceolata.AAC.1